jgi:hypothetical protein
MNKIKSFIAPSGASSFTESAEALTAALSGYKADIDMTDLKRISNSFASLSDDDLTWLAEAQAKLGIKGSLEERIRDAADQNQQFYQDLVNLIPSVTQQLESSPAVPRMVGSISARVRVLPWVVAREWGNDPGLVEERNEMLQPILEAVKSYFPQPGAKILVPGSSCGRMLYELAALGHQPTGIEFDALRLLCSAHVFQAHETKSTIRPFVLETCNRLHAEDNTREVSIPDIPIDTSIISKITVNGTEFFEAVAGIEESEYDCIVTSFFIDTITDVEKYISELTRVLKQGGVWINFGPLNFHYPSERIAPQAPKRELSVEAFLDIIKKSGFEIKDQNIMKSTYLSNRRSMMQTNYGCLYAVAILS